MNHYMYECIQDANTGNVCNSKGNMLSCISTFFEPQMPCVSAWDEREESRVSRNRYVGDYHLADSLDDRGKIRTEVEYVGGRYSFVKDAETVRKTKILVLVLCAAGWLLYVAAMIPVSVAMRTIYTAIPFALIAVPLALLTGTILEVFPQKERFIHRYADRMENRYPASAAFIVILSGIALAGQGVSLIRGLELTGGDILAAVCAAALLAVGIFASRAGKNLKCEKLP